MSKASLPVTITYYTVARTITKLGFYNEGSEAAFPPKKYNRLPWIWITLLLSQLVDTKETLSRAYSTRLTLVLNLI
jgi:hypothetical protein